MQVLELFHEDTPRKHRGSLRVSFENIRNMIPTALAPIEAAASCGGVRRRSYSGKRERAP